MGAGKTYWGNMLARDFGVNFIDLDDYIEDKYESSITDIFRKYGEDVFRRIESEVLNDICKHDEQTIVATGGGLPCYNDNMSMMKKFGVVIYLRRTVEELYSEIVQHVDKRPLLSNLSDGELKQRISDMLQERKYVYEQADYIVDDYDPRDEIENIMRSKL